MRIHWRRRMLANFAERKTANLANDMCFVAKTPSENGIIDTDSMTCVNAFESSSEHCDMTSEDESIGNPEVGSPLSLSSPIDIVSTPTLSPHSVESDSTSIGHYFCVFCRRIFNSESAAKHHYSNLLLRDGRENSYVEKWITEFLLFQTGVQSTVGSYFQLQDCPVCEIVKTLPCSGKTPLHIGTEEEHVMRHLCYYPYQCVFCRLNFFGIKEITSHIQRMHSEVINYNNYIGFHVIPELEQLMDNSKSVNDNLCCFNCSEQWSDDLDSMFTSDPETIIYSDDNEDSDFFYEKVGDSRFKLRRCTVILERLQCETVDRLISLKRIRNSRQETGIYPKQVDRKRYVNDSKTAKKRRVRTMSFSIPVVPLQREEIQKYCSSFDSFSPFAYKLTRNNEAVNNSSSLFQTMSLFDYNVGVPEYFYSLKSIVECNLEDSNDCIDSFANVSFGANRNRKKLRIGFSKSTKKKKRPSYEDTHPSKGLHTKVFRHYDNSNVISVPQSDYSLYKQRLYNPNEEAVEDELTRILERFLCENESDSEDDMSSIGPDIFSDDVDDVDDDVDNSSLSSYSIPSIENISTLTNGVMSSSLENLTVDSFEDIGRVLNNSSLLKDETENNRDLVNIVSNGKST